MFLKDRKNGHLVEVIQIEELFDPFCKRIKGRYQVGESDQENEEFLKSNLVFMSGEELPRCWKY